MEDHQQVTRPSADWFDEFMFGSGRKAETSHIQQGANPNQYYFDYDTLIVNIDKLMDSVDNLKPLFKQISPYIEQIWKKK